MRILPYLSLCCGVLEARFSNLTEFESSHRHDAVTYPHDISQNKCKRPHYATRKMSKLYIKNKYHHLTLQKEFRLLLNKGVHGNVWSAKHTTIKNVFKIINCRKFFRQLTSHFEPIFVPTLSPYYSDVIMSAMTSQITGVSIVYSTACSCADQRKHQSSASQSFVRGNHRWPVNSPHKGPVTRKMFPCDEFVM